MTKHARRAAREHDPYIRWGKPAEEFGWRKLLAIFLTAWGLLALYVYIIERGVS